MSKQDELSFDWVPNEKEQMEPHQTKRLQSHDCLFANEMLLPVVVLQSEVSHLGFDGFFYCGKPLLVSAIIVVLVVESTEVQTYGAFFFLFFFFFYIHCVQETMHLLGLLEGI